VNGDRRRRSFPRVLARPTPDAAVQCGSPQQIIRDRLPAIQVPVRAPNNGSGGEKLWTRSAYRSS